MRVLDLFAGIGGFSLGLERAGMTTVGFCEIEPFCRQVLAKHWPGVWQHDDIRTLTANAVRAACGAVDLIAGGFPCQPVSVAGKRKGEADSRWLWPEMFRLVRELRPRWLLAENVPGLRTKGADRVLSDLEGQGYAVWPLVVGADDVGAPQRRKRAWIVGYANSDLPGERLELPVFAGEQKQAGIDDARAGYEVGNAINDGAGVDRGSNRGPEWESTDALQPAAVRQAHGAGDAGRIAAAGGDRADAVGNATGLRCGQGGQPATTNRWPARPGEPQHEWEAPRLVEFSVGFNADGLSVKLARRHNKQALRALGNAVVPPVAYAIAKGIVLCDAGIPVHGAQAQGEPWPEVKS